jgi:hypothetical protein
MFEPVLDVIDLHTFEGFDGAIALDEKTRGNVP